MITKTISGSENYQCKIVKITEYRKHPNADKLFIINVDHNNVITGVEPKLEDLYVYFPVLSKINAEFLSFINGFDKPELNQDQFVKGFFTSKCRVKPIKLRGLPSEGYLHPLKDLEAFLEAKIGLKLDPIHDLGSGDEFNEVNGVLICDKYTVVKAASNNSTGPKEKKSPESSIVDGQFAFHGTTDQLRKNLHQISPDDLIEISYKKHGCLPSFQGIKMWTGETKKISKIQIGDEVVGFDHKTNTFVKSKVLQTFKNGPTKEWLSIKKTNNCGRKSGDVEKLYCTENHKIFVGDSYKEAGELKVGDSVFTRKQYRNPSSFQKEFLIGKLLGDGSVNKKNCNWSLTISHKEDHSSYLSTCERLFGELSARTIYTSTSGYGTIMKRVSTRADFGIKKLLEDFIVNGKKVIPQSLSLTPVSLAFWYMDDGGLVHTELQKDRAAIAICSFSKESSSNLQLVLEKYGFSNFTIRTDKKGYERLTFNASDAEKLFLDIRKYIPPVMQYKLPEHHRGFYENFEGEDLNVTEEEDLFEEKIISIEKKSSKDTRRCTEKYDIETETHNFLASGILIHNSSLVVSNILTKRKLSWLERLGAKVGVKVKDQEYGIVISSRKVIKTESNQGTGYYKSDIWTEAGNKLKDVIPKGYSLYCEIIGYFGDSYIQKGYDYGCAPGEFKTYVYKITHTNPDGFVINLTANQIKQFCEKYALLFSDTLRYYGYASALYPDLDPDSTTWREEFLERLEKEFTEKDCIMCVNKVPEEGIVLVKENMFEYQAFKLKSHAFLMYEDKQLEAEEVNLEDNQL